MIAGAGAGLVSSVVTCPLDVVKTKLQAQGGLHHGERGYHGLVGAFLTFIARTKSLAKPICAGTCTRIWTEEGVRGFYRGLGPTIYGYLPTWAIVRRRLTYIRSEDLIIAQYFTIYDLVKLKLSDRRDDDGELYVLRSRYPRPK